MTRSREGAAGLRIKKSGSLHKIIFRAENGEGKVLKGDKMKEGRARTAAKEAGRGGRLKRTKQRRSYITEIVEEDHYRVEHLCYTTR